MLSVSSVAEEHSAGLDFLNKLWGYCNLGNNKELLVTLPVALGNLFTNLQVSDISASADGAMPFGAQRINDNQIKVYCNTPYDSSGDCYYLIFSA